MKSSAAPGDRQFVTALARGLDVLRCFDRPRVVLGVSEISRRLGLSQPTVWRLCYTLLQCGFLVRAPSGTGLCIGAPAITLGYAAAQGLDMCGVARPYLQRIVDETGASATLSVRQGREMLLMAQIDGDFLVRNKSVGWRAPLDTLAAGLAILSTLPAEERARTVAEIEAEDPVRWARHRDRVEAAVISFAHLGYVELAGSLGGQYTAVAVSLFETGTAPDAQWALACGGVAGRWTSQELARAAELLIETRALLVPAFAALGRSPDALPAARRHPPGLDSSARRETG